MCYTVVQRLVGTELLPTAKFEVQKKQILTTYQPCLLPPWRPQTGHFYAILRGRHKSSQKLAKRIPRARARVCVCVCVCVCVFFGGVSSGFVERQAFLSCQKKKKKKKKEMSTCRPREKTRRQSLLKNIVLAFHLCVRLWRAPRTSRSQDLSRNLKESRNAPSHLPAKVMSSLKTSLCIL